MSDLKKNNSSSFFFKKKKGKGKGDFILFGKRSKKNKKKTQFDSIKGVSSCGLYKGRASNECNLLPEH
jgi:hypothetical protein